MTARTVTAAEPPLPPEHCITVHHTPRAAGAVRAMHRLGAGERSGDDMTDTRDCHWCGSTIERAPSRFINQRTGEEHQHHFCDKGCRSEWEAENFTGEAHPNYDGGKVEVECEWCGDTVRKKPCKADSVDRHFCDHDCQGKWLSENVVGEDHHRWKGGGQPYYGTGWNRARAESRERDGYKCQYCGISEEDLPYELDVHHKTPVREFDDPSDAHTLENLVTLCRSCHRRNHN